MNTIIPRKSEFLSISEAYKNRNGKLMEDLTAFRVGGKDDVPDLHYNIWRDFQFAHAAKQWLGKDRVSNSLIIVELGAAHLLPVALELARAGVEVYFNLPRSVHSRFRLLAGLLSDEFKSVSTTSLADNSYAILIDTHRLDSWKAETDQYDVLLSTLPTAAELRKSEISHIYHLCEAPIGSLPKLESDCLDYMKRQAEKGESIPSRFLE